MSRVSSLCPLLLIASLGACGTRTQDAPDVADAAVAPQATPQTRDVSLPRGARTIDQAVRLAARGAPAFSPFLAPNREKGFLLEGSAFTSFGFRAAEQKSFEHLGARIPAVANDAVVVGVSRFERFQLKLVPVGASPAHATIDEGRVVYPDAYPSTDVIAVTSPQVFEEFFLLRDERAPSTFAWSVELPRGIRNVRHEDTGALVFADARDEGVLRMPPPFAVDANGTRREAELRWDGRGITVHLDKTGLAYPILLDPALEQFLWEKKASSGTPGARNGARMTFHANVTLMVNGNDSGGTALADTWEWNGTTWTKRCGAGTTACGINASSFGNVAYHAGRNRTFLMHGVGAYQTAEWTGSAWTSITNLAYPPPSGAPIGRASYTLSYQSNPPGGAAPRLLMFAGSTFGGHNDLWGWNGTWTALAPTTTTGIDCSVGAACRYAHGAAYDSNTRKLVVFGGEGVGDATYEWNDVSWTAKATAVKPSWRTGHQMVYDTKRKRVVLFGGQYAVGDDTWEYDGSNWAPITVITKPPARQNHAMAFDSVRGRVVVYGGVWGGSVVPAEVWEYHGFGGACSTAAECDTGACVDGVCCESSSCGSCQACDRATGPGVCRPVIGADDPDTCAAPSATCDATGACKKLQGQACTASSQCLSNFCVDGVCCNTACNERCQACSAATKQSGTADGTCGAAKDNTNPHGDCTAGAGGVCGQTGFCDGAGACRIKVSGTSCGAGVCDGNTFKGQQCDGLGACVSNPTGTDCAPGKCVSSTGCKSTCTTDVDCDAAAFCDGGTCKTKKANGEACTAASECQNPFCVDGVCCNKPCTGQCEACDSTGAVGTCVPITKEPVGGRPKCDAAPAGEPCKARACDGVDGSTCAGWVGSSTTCRTAACTDGKAVTDLYCDGKGNCPTDAPKVCAPFACGDVTCKETCASDADCASPSTCDAASGKCVNAAKCDGDHTLTSADGKTTTDCAPYKCDASGTCKNACASTTECAAPNVCASGVCTPPPSADTADSGGCAVGAPGADRGGAFLVLLLVASRVRRRRAGGVACGR